MNTLRQLLTCLTLALSIAMTSIAPAWAFCGFYVGGADAKLFNKASQVIIARKDDKTILTMANDFQGSVKDFALVVPGPRSHQKRTGQHWRQRNPEEARYLQSAAPSGILRSTIPADHQKPPSE